MYHVFIILIRIIQKDTAALFCTFSQHVRKRISGTVAEHSKRYLSEIRRPSLHRDCFLAKEIVFHKNAVRIIASHDPHTIVIYFNNRHGQGIILQ